MSFLHLSCSFVLVAFLPSGLDQDWHPGAPRMYLVNWPELNIVQPGICFIIICNLICISGTFFLHAPAYLSVRKPFSSPCFTRPGLDLWEAGAPAVVWPLRTLAHGLCAPGWSCQALGALCDLDCDILGDRDRAVFVMRIGGMILQALLVQGQKSIYLVDEC